MNQYIELLKTIPKANLIKINQHYFNRLIKLLEYCQPLYAKTSYKKISGHERHHIIPRSWNGDNSWENLIDVPYRYHFIIHYLMWKAFPSDKSMALAFYLMAHRDDELKINSKVFKILKDEQYGYSKEYSSFKGKVPVRHKITDEIKLISTEEYKLLTDDSEYEHICLNREISVLEIEKMKEEFRNGTRISSRKNNVMCRNINTEETRLITIDDYYSDTNIDWIAISKGISRSEEHKKIVSEYMKTFVKTDIQKESAKKLMYELHKERITCECCNRVFDKGNYTKHIKNITNTGKKYPKEYGEAVSARFKKLHEEFGAVRPIYIFEYNTETYITYNANICLKYLKISKPTFRKRYSPKKIGSSRERANIKTKINLTEYKVFEDVFKNDF